MQKLEVAKAVLPSLVALIVGAFSAVTSMHLTKAQFPAEVESRFFLASIEKVAQEVPTFLAAIDGWFGHLTLNIPVRCGDYAAWIAETDTYRRDAMEAYYRVSVRLNLEYPPDQQVNAISKELLDFVRARETPTVELESLLCPSIESEVSRSDNALGSKPSIANPEHADKPAGDSIMSDKRATETLLNLQSNYFSNYRQYNALNHMYQDAVSEWISANMRKALEF